jgi:hypothetical protein
VTSARLTPATTSERSREASRPGGVGLATPSSTGSGWLRPENRPKGTKSPDYANHPPIVRTPRSIYPSWTNRPIYPIPTNCPSRDNLRESHETDNHRESVNSDKRRAWRTSAESREPGESVNYPDPPDSVNLPDCRSPLGFRTLVPIDTVGDRTRVRVDPLYGERFRGRREARRDPVTNLSVRHRGHRSVGSVTNVTTSPRQTSHSIRAHAGTR